MDKYDMAEEAYKRGLEAAEKTLSQLRRENIQLRAERDAAVADLEEMAKMKVNSPCHWCANAWGDDPTLCLECDEEKMNGNFKWRGDKTHD